MEIKKRNKKKREARALRLIRKWHPMDARDMEGLEIPVIKLGEGVFRTCYRIRNTDLVIKFPLVTDDDEVSYDALEHARAEYRKILKFKEFKFLRPYIPQVYYFDFDNGVIVTRYYWRLPKWQLDEGINDFVNKLLIRLTGMGMSDIHGDNVRRNGGDIVFTDLGY